MAKERNYNPVQAQRKAEKAKTIKKGKAEIQARRNEKLARKNPERIQKQIDDLEAIKSSGATLTKHEEQVLDGLQKELRAVNKAREAQGDQAPSFSRHDRSDGLLGKRRRDGDETSGDEDVPENVRRIPMPRDTPPPIPKDVMDKWWAKRRARRDAQRAAWEGPRPPGPESGATAPDDNRPERGGTKTEERERRTPAAPPPLAKSVYSAQPVLRDLRKEATAAFMPTAVRLKMERAGGKAGLVEEEEARRLESAGYLPSVGKQVEFEEAEDEDEEA